MTRTSGKQKGAVRAPRRTDDGSARTRGDLRELLLPTLYEDDRVLVIDKPAGVDVGGKDDTETAGVVEILGEVRRGRDELHPVNRLNRYESGVLILAKTAGAARTLRAALKRGEGRFEYVAVCRGRMSKPRVTVSGAGKVPHGQDRRGRTGTRQRTVKQAADAPGSREFSTTIERIDAGPSRVLVQCRTSAPTTHVLRAQLRGAELRLVGDALHDQSKRKASPQGTFLHLARLTVPGSGSVPTFRTAGLPGAAGDILLGQRSVERPLHAALVRRLPLLVQRDTDAQRLLVGDVEDIPGVSVERLGEVLVIQIHGDRPVARETLQEIHAWYGQSIGTSSTYLKTFVKSRGDVTDDLERAHSDGKPFAGRRTDSEVVVHERGLQFAIRPYDGFSVGLFLDQRDNRSWVRKHSAGKDVLNLFSYTCGFSVAAAMGGARSTVSVDLSPRSLEWGKRNFELNGLEPGSHDFFADDAMDFLKRTAKKERRFDLIVIDPPSFAHGRKRGKRFSIADDLPELVQAASVCLRDGGQMLVCTNHRKMTPRMLRDRVKAGMAGRRAKTAAAPGLPLDFAMDRDYAKSVVVEVAP